jgi:hypothetical protein
MRSSTTQSGRGRQLIVYIREFSHKIHNGCE